MSAANDPRLLAAIGQWHAAGRGQRRQLVERLASDMGISIATAYRLLGQATLKPPRQRRADAGALVLSRDEAQAIWAAVRETTKQTGNNNWPVMDVVASLRANDAIRAARIDEATGEFKPLSESAIRRAMRAYGYSFEAMEAPGNSTRLASPHPNWCWQIDASVSRQFYLADDGMRVMDKAVFYRGKPANFVAINERRIWRYCVTDHASGAIEVFYVQGAESAANVIASLIHTMTRRANGTMHGVPRILMCDPGPGMKAAPVRNFCAALGIRLIAHAAGHSNVTGQVENAHYLVERHFEASLQMRKPARSIEEINTDAQVWAHGYNASMTHSRTGMARRDGWLRITGEQLVLAPAIAVLRMLANTSPKQATVRDCMVRYKGRIYSLRDLPGGTVNGQRVLVCTNALDPASLRVLTTDAQGDEAHFIAPRLEHDDFGFIAGSPVIGERFAAAPESPAQARDKALERLAMDATTDAEAAANRKAKRLPFGGRIDPMKHLREAAPPPAIPRAATPSPVAAPSVVAGYIAPEPVRAELAPLNHVEAAGRLKPLVELVGASWSTPMYMRTAERWPDGVPVDAIEAWAAELARPERGGLRLIEGGAA
ncbi:MAG: DDE-type integrase/transposase/recombinase [Proteobacteria bacterium]|nr:DDE-type integrase/transposase/recombinase [Pseudomonadota bacterium]